MILHLWCVSSGSPPRNDTARLKGIYNFVRYCPVSLVGGILFFDPARKSALSYGEVVRLLSVCCLLGDNGLRVISVCASLVSVCGGAHTHVHGPLLCLSMKPFVFCPFFCLLLISASPLHTRRFLWPAPSTLAVPYPAWVRITHP